MSKLKKYVFRYDNSSEKWAAIPKNKLEKYLNKEFKRGEDTGILYADDIFTLYKFIDK